MSRLRFAGILAAVLALPAVCSAYPLYEEPTQLCHDLAESAYQQAVARGDGLPDGAYEQTQADCEYDAYRAYLVASPDVPLSELVEFDSASRRESYCVWSSFECSDAQSQGEQL